MTLQHSKYDADDEDVAEGEDPVAAQDEIAIVAEQVVDDFPIDSESTIPKQQTKFTQVNRTCKNCKCHKREKDKMKKRGQRLEQKLAKMEDELILLRQVSCHFVKLKI